MSLKDTDLSETVFMVMVIACVIGVLVAICSIEKPVVFSEQWIEYELIGYDPPKHFYVDLREVESGLIKRHVYVGKHCSRYKELYVGKRFTLKETKYHYEESDRWSSDIDAYSVCPR